jgi:hypothetical protein
MTTQKLSEAQELVRAKTIAKLVKSDRGAVLDFFQDELAYLNPGGGDVDDTTFLKALQVSVDAEGSDRYDSTGAVIPKIRPWMSYKEMLEIPESGKTATLPEAREAAKQEALERRKTPKELEAEAAVKAAKTPFEWYDAWKASISAQVEAKFERWASAHPADFNALMLRRKAELQARWGPNRDLRDCPPPGDHRLRKFIGLWPEERLH